jgi:hypothetical protein
MLHIIYNSQSWLVTRFSSHIYIYIYIYIYFNMANPRVGRLLTLVLWNICGIFVWYVILLCCTFKPLNFHMLIPLRYYLFNFVLFSCFRTLYDRCKNFMKIGFKMILWKHVEDPGMEHTIRRARAHQRSSAPLPMLEHTYARVYIL